MSQATDVYQAGSKAKLLDEVLRHRGTEETTADAWTCFHPDLDIPANFPVIPAFAGMTAHSRRLKTSRIFR